MISDTEITAIYRLVKKAYEPVTKEVLQELMKSRAGVEKPKVLFPPNNGSTFDAQVAELGFLQRDCAVISAFRQRNQDGSRRYKKDNEASTEKLVADLIDKHLGFLPLDGCFREKKEQKASHEKSFFVYDDGSHNAKEFFTKIYKLSERYNQDSFLYKSAGMTRFAFLISTNDETRQADGDINPAGKLYLNLPPVGPYSNLATGRFTFRVDKPTEEELAYSKEHYKK